VIGIRKILCGTANCTAALLLLGCYPHPHDFTRVPAISGVLLNAGKPVTGVNVYVAQTRADDGNYCRDMKPVTTTDSNGNFHVGPVIEHHLFASLLNPPQFILQETSICFEIAAKQYLGMTVVASTYHPERFEAACDLYATHAVYLGNVSVPGNPAGVCSNPGRSSP
jgi:hypothetical protein